MEAPVKHSSRPTLGLVPATLFVALATLAAIGSGCAGVKNGGTGGGGISGTAGHPGTGTGGHGVVPMACNGLCKDFPVDPIVDPGVTPSSFPSTVPSGAGPCVIEPEDNTLFPNNWLRPRVKVQGSNGPLQITIHSDREANDLIVYTVALAGEWRMPKDIWLSLTSHVQDSPISVSVRGTTGGATTVSFKIAPVGASGSMVFWAANPGPVDINIVNCRPPNAVTLCLNTAELQGFSVGDEKTETVLSVGQVIQPSRKDDGNPSPVTCIGCHTATPDQSFVTFVDSYPWRAVTASVAGAAATPNPSGVAFPTQTPAGLKALLQPGWGPFAFHINKTNDITYWQPGKRIGVASLGLLTPNTPDYSNGPDQNDSPHLAWINLEATNVQTGNNGNWDYVSFAAGATIDSGNALGFIQHTGDMCGTAPCGAAMPAWSHDGTKILYVSTNASQSGRFNREVPNPGATGDPTTSATTQNSNPQRSPGLTNLYTVLFNNGVGGVASPVTGAATPDNEEYYPAYSPDDNYVAFTRVAAGQTMFANPNAEIYVVATAGGSAQRLAANDPPACTGKRSPGVNNHWAKWSPDVQGGGSLGKYYWMIFSSNRAGLTGTSTTTGRTVNLSQLYLAPILVDETGGVSSFPAIYLWNQPTDRVNTTPAWETFDIPIIP
jgi:hypothetical protein